MPEGAAVLGFQAGPGDVERIHQRYAETHPKLLPSDPLKDRELSKMSYSKQKHKLLNLEWKLCHEWVKSGNADASRSPWVIKFHGGLGCGYVTL